MGKNCDPLFIYSFIGENDEKKGRIVCRDRCLFMVDWLFAKDNDKMVVFVTCRKLKWMIQYFSAGLKNIKIT